MSNEPLITTLFPQKTGERYDLAQKPSLEMFRRNLGRSLAFFATLSLLLSVLLEGNHLLLVTTWTRVEATVISGKIYRKQSRCGGQAINTVPCDEYSFRCTVSYRVAQSVREGQLDSPRFYYEIDALKWADRFPTGRQLPIVYKPSDPSDIRLVDEPPPFLNALTMVKVAFWLFIPGLLLIRSSRIGADSI